MESWYYAPDTLEWESAELAYSGFLGWLAEGALKLFYRHRRCYSSTACMSL
ncbi:hypothetical protein B9T62_10575 [Paenibacillus donghaensis]|uniref:Uncharacterized protein n=1 Tax=Paenibacillus donghaensis TaxID=414771 RepID=A0A2Z2KQX1_9BACL|nr:hypothetical protein B9T62_10575 [Paenibacillus donghaensis]